MSLEGSMHVVTRRRTGGAREGSERSFRSSRRAPSPFLLLLFGLPFGLPLAGCSPKYYAPNTENVPLLQERSEGALSLLASEDRVEIQSAYAFATGLSGMLNVGFHDVKDDEEGDGGEGSFLEIGPGYYRPLKNRLVFECYGLLGYGELENHFPSTADESPGTTGKLDAKLVRAAAQPTLGWKSRFFDAALSARVGVLSYFDIEGDLVFEGKDQVEYLEENRSHFLVEPAVTLRAGYGSLKVQAQWVASLNTTTPDFRQDEQALTFGVFLSRDIRPTP
jgi:hypothetical protein